MGRPERTDVQSNTFALVSQNEGQELWQYEPPLSWETPEWVMKKRYDHDKAPALDYKNAELVTEQNGGESQTVIYAKEIRLADSTQEDEQSLTVERGYVVKLSDGQVVPNVPSNEAPSPTQEENMAEFTEVLLEKGLLDEITIPYFPSSSRKNCLINDEKYHPDGREMANKSELSNGLFVFTGLNKQAKKKYMKELAERMDLEIEFLGEW